MSERDQAPLGRLAGVSHARLGVGAAVVLVVLALAVAVVMAAVTAAGSAPRPVVSPSSTAGAADVAVESGGGAVGSAPALVHVLGEVRSPGIYELSGDARVLDAIAAAGGLTEAAEAGAVNLARRVVDGEQLVVPKIGEVAVPTAGERSGSATGGAGGVISLSSASVEQLDSLPRIGPAIAQRIVDWREAGGRFSSVDDLLQIDGIGAKTVESLRGLVVP